MKFSRFLNRYSRNSTSLTYGLGRIDDPNKITDQSFTRRQSIDQSRKHVGRYTDSNIVRGQETRRPANDAQPLTTGREAPVVTARPLSPAPRAGYRFAEPPSRNHPH